LKFCIAENRRKYGISRSFAKNNGKYYNFRSYRRIDAVDAETHFLAHYRLFQLVFRSKRSRCCFTPNRPAWSLPVTWQSWYSHHSIRNFRKPPAIHKLCGSIIADWNFILRKQGISRFFCKKIVEKLFFLFAPQKDVEDAETHLLSHKTRQSVKQCDLCRCARR